MLLINVLKCEKCREKSVLPPMPHNLGFWSFVQNVRLLMHRPHLSGYFWKRRIFFRRLKKYTVTRIVVPNRACAVWCMTSSYSKTSIFVSLGRDPFNQNSNRSDREKRTTSKGGPVFSKLFRLDRTDPLSFGPKFPESLVEWIARQASTREQQAVFKNLHFEDRFLKSAFSAPENAVYV